VEVGLLVRYRPMVRRLAEYFVGLVESRQLAAVPIDGPLT
jgi:hypothetical protein